MKQAFRGLLVALLLLCLPVKVWAAGAFPEKTGSGSIGLQGTISSAPPTRGATITTPGNGASFSSLPVTVSGLCPANTLVKIFSNNVFVGSVVCQGGSYSVQISLFNGQNELVAKVYDALDQAGPDSNMVTVTFNDGQFAEFGSHISLSSIYAVRGAPPGEELTWPIILSGGTGPYAINIDWGDGTSDLLSQPFTGTLTLKHTYKQSGVYKVIVKATDKNGGVAFLQLVGQATGAGQSAGSAKSGGGATAVKTVVIWWPAIAMIPLIFAAFWVGRRHELFTIRKQLERSRDNEAA